MIVFVAVASAQFNVPRVPGNVPQPVYRQPVVAGRTVPHPYPVVVQEPNADNQARVLRSESSVNADSFQYEYETSNGIVANEAGQLKQFPEEQSAVVSQGGYSYTAPDGVTYTVKYVADENGYQPTGDHLPVTPAIPDYIGTVTFCEIIFGAICFSVHSSCCGCRNICSNIEYLLTSHNSSEHACRQFFEYFFEFSMNLLCSLPYMYINRFISSENSILQLVLWNISESIHTWKLKQKDLRYNLDMPAVGRAPS